MLNNKYLHFSKPAVWAVLLIFQCGAFSQDEAFPQESSSDSFLTPRKSLLESSLPSDSVKNSFEFNLPAPVVEKNINTADEQLEEINTEHFSQDQSQTPQEKIKPLPPQRLRAVKPRFHPSYLLKNLHWKGGAEFYTQQEESGSQILLKIKNYFKAGYNFSDNINFKTEWLINVQQGNTQLVFARQNTANAIEVRSLHAGYRGIKNLDLRAGIFNMDLLSDYEPRGKTPLNHFYKSSLSMPLLMSDWPFIGFSQKYSYLPRAVSPFVDDMFFIFRETIPSGAASLNRFEQIKDIPQFFMGSLFARGESPIPYAQQIGWIGGDTISFTGGFTGFYFRNLSPDMAAAGRIYGNTVKRHYTGGYTEFKHGFYGIHLNGGAYFNLVPELDLEFKTAFLWNLGAGKAEGEDSANNKGQSFYLGLHIPLVSNKVYLNPSLERFVNQSDASVAYYNSREYGHSNRHGYIVGCRINFKRYKAFIDLKYAFVSPVAEDLSLWRHSNYFKFSLGVDYEQI